MSPPPCSENGTATKANLWITLIAYTLWWTAQAMGNFWYEMMVWWPQKIWGGYVLAEVCCMLYMHQGVGIDYIIGISRKLAGKS